VIDVIVVDDEAGVQEFVRLTLLRVGATCRAASSADNALKLAASQWPDLFVIDLGLPGPGDGWKLWQALVDQAKGRPLRVILLAGHLTGVGYEAANRRGAAAVLTKPVTERTLARGVLHAMAG
jgi:CheY-like chemotaxis protein